MEIYKDSWQGLSVMGVETRLSTPGPESELVRESYKQTLARLHQLICLSQPLLPINGELYIPIGGDYGLKEAVGKTVDNWGWEPEDRTWIKTPISGRLGGQRWCLVLSSKETYGESRFRVGLWVPESPNKGLHVIHSLYPDQNLMGTKLKTALLANDIWIHLNEERGKRGVLAEWGIRTNQDQALERVREIPLSDIIPSPMHVPTHKLVAV